MDKQSDDIRREISETRGQLEGTVEALAYKTDITARATDAVHDKVDSLKNSVKDRVGGALGLARRNVDALSVSAQSAMPSAEQAKSIAQNNPLGLALGSIAIGFLIGSLLPATRIEREQIGDLGNQLTDSAKSKVGDLLEQGKSTATQIIMQTAQSVSEASAVNNDEHGEKDPSTGEKKITDAEIISFVER